MAFKVAARVQAQPPSCRRVVGAVLTIQPMRQRFRPGGDAVGRKRSVILLFQTGRGLTRNDAARAAVAAFYTEGHWGEVDAPINEAMASAVK